MSASEVESNDSPLIFNNTKVQALESTLNKSLICFKELVLDFQQLQNESEHYKSQLMTQKELCERNYCSSAESLKSIIESKNKMLQSLASTLTRLNETKNLSLVDEAFRIIFGDSSPNKDVVIETTTSQTFTEEQQTSIKEDISFKDDSLNEIEGTPTGRKSPIIQSKKSRHRNIRKSNEIRDKIKCPDNWSTPEKKTIKLTHPVKNNSKAGSKYRQSRLNLVKVKQTSLVDLTCSPEFSGGLHSSRSDRHEMKPLIKKESLEDDETILPSPTSVPLNFKFKTIKSSPLKVPKAPISLKIKKENVSKSGLGENIENVPKANIIAMDDSINILNQLPKSSRYKDVDKVIKIDNIGNDEMHFDIQPSMSLLQQEKKVPAASCSPKKRPLSENLNITNTPTKKEIEPVRRVTVDNAKRRIAEAPEPMYREPAPRKRSEKKALPGWCCEECEYFFGDLYEGDPEAMAKRVEECSKHRGRQNPARPKTPPNFWNPRWSVPEDTEELNRMNNAI